MTTNTKVPTDHVQPIVWPFPTYKGKPYTPPKDQKKQIQQRVLDRSDAALL